MILRTCISITLTVVFFFFAQSRDEAVAAEPKKANFIKHCSFGHCRIQKWGEPILGTPATIRYYFLKDSVITDKKKWGSAACGRLAVPGSKVFRGRPHAYAAFEHDVERAMSEWSRHANVDFVKVASPQDADFHIGFVETTRGHSEFDAYLGGTHVTPGTEMTPSVQSSAMAALCFSFPFEPNISMYDIALHELGHALGLDHVDYPFKSVMNAQYIRSSRKLEEIDIRGVQFLYGPR